MSETCISKKAKKDLDFIIKMQDKLIPFILDEKIGSLPSIVRSAVKKIATKETGGLKEIKKFLDTIPDC